MQRTPLVLNEVHRLIEADGLRFILTGSSARSLRRRGVNLLGGRARTHHLYPLTAVEAGADFALERALIHGQLPSVYTQPDPDEYLASYVENYLRQEVLEEGRTRNLATFSRFLGSLNEGRSINSGDTLSAIFTNPSVMLYAQRRPEHKLRRHTGTRSPLPGSPYRSTKAGA